MVIVISSAIVLKIKKEKQEKDLRDRLYSNLASHRKNLLVTSLPLICVLSNTT